MRAVLRVLAWPLLAFAIVLGTPRDAAAETTVTILYDAFGKDPHMRKDWGFAALVEHEGTTILFDTGNDPGILAANMAADGVDLDAVDFAVISHRHGDHIGGLSHVLDRRPELRVYTPRENFSVFGMEARSGFLAPAPELPAHLRYFDGAPPAMLHFGSAWVGGDFEWVGESREIAPGIHLIAEHGDWGVDLAVEEIALAIETERGVLLLVGCSHPRLATMIEATIRQTGAPVDSVMGGFHLLPAGSDQVLALAARLAREWKLRRVIPAHCTGEPAMALLRRALGGRFEEAGLGATFRF